MVAVCHQRGMTLAELMVSMALSLVLLAGVIEVYLGSKASYRLGDGLARVQENGRFALDFIARDIRMAGFLGCRGAKEKLTIRNNLDSDRLRTDFGADVAELLGDFDGSRVLRGYSIGDTLMPGEDLYALGLRSGAEHGHAVPDTDALLFVYAQSCNGGRVKQLMATTSADVVIAGPDACNIDSGDIVLVADCSNGDIVRIAHDRAGDGGGDEGGRGDDMPSPSGLVHSLTGGNTSDSLSTQYGPGASVYKLKVSVFFIGNGTSGGPALFRRRLAGRGLVNEELVEGVEDLVFLYGEDMDGDPNRVADRYVRAPRVSDFDAVVSVRPMLLLHTVEENVAAKTVSYFYDGTRIEARDRRLRRAFATTVNLRNRTL